MLSLLLLPALARPLSRAIPSLCARTQVLGEIRPYLVGTGGGELELVKIDGPVVKARISLYTQLQSCRAAASSVFFPAAPSPRIPPLHPVANAQHPLSYYPKFL